MLGSSGTRNPRYGFQDQLDLIQVDWDGKIVWKFNHTELVKAPRSKPAHIARQHHLHMILRGLPGKGNLLVFNNGGWGDYGIPSGTSHYEEALGGILNMVYRAYRMPYGWVPQLAAPQEASIRPPDPADFRV